MKIKLVSILLILAFVGTNGVMCQTDSLRIVRLVKETQDVFLSPFAQGIQLSPFELREYHRDQTIKNIEWVDSYNQYIYNSSKIDTVSVVIKNNQNIIQKPNDQFNSRTYSYHKDGRINKTFRGQHVNDLYLYDENDFLIQHGFGSELKRAKPEEKTFEWYNVNRNRLEYITSFDEENRLSQIKTMGHYFGPAVEYETEDYLWDEAYLVSKTTIMKYNEGSTDTTFVKFTYDSIGLLSTIEFREEGESNWSSTQYETQIEHQENKNIKIVVYQENSPVLTMVYDNYDNWIEMIRSYKTMRREIQYRNRERRK